MNSNQTKEYTDEKLVEITLQNLNNYKFLIERYEKKLFFYIQRISNVNKEDCEDILQEVFIKSYKNLNGYNPKYKFSSWIYRIAHNETLNYIRSRKNIAKEIANNLETDIFDTLASKVNIENEAIQEANSEYVHKVLAKLDDKYREVLVLKFIEEKDYEEISEILHISSGTVGSLISRAKVKFKELMKTE